MFFPLMFRVMDPKTKKQRAKNAVKKKEQETQVSTEQDRSTAVY